MIVKYSNSINISKNYSYNIKQDILDLKGKYLDHNSNFFFLSDYENNEDNKKILFLASTINQDGGFFINNINDFKIDLKTLSLEDFKTKTNQNSRKTTELKRTKHLETQKDDRSVNFGCFIMFLVALFIAYILSL